MATKVEQRSYEEALSWLREHGFDLIEAPGTQGRVFLRKYNVSAAIQKDGDDGVKIFAYPGYLIGSEISKLVNRGYQQFLKTAKTEVPATADHLKALQQFTEELKEGLGLPVLYNESLGTVSESYHYDRIKDRDKPAAERPKRPWEKAGAVAAADLRSAESATVPLQIATPAWRASGGCAAKSAYLVRRPESGRSNSTWAASVQYSKIRNWVHM